MGASFVKHPPSDLLCGAANDCNQRAHPAVLTPFVSWLKGRAIVGLPCLCLDGGLGVLQKQPCSQRQWPPDLVLCKLSNHWQMTQGRCSGPGQKHRKVWAILGERQLLCTHSRIVGRIERVCCIEDRHQSAVVLPVLSQALASINPRRQRQRLH